MKDRIEKKLEEYANSIIEKENVTMEEINFIVYMLNKIEAKEQAEESRLNKEKSDKEWRERMANLIGGMWYGL